MACLSVSYIRAKGIVVVWPTTVQYVRPCDRLIYKYSISADANEGIPTIRREVVLLETVSSCIGHPM